MLVKIIVALFIVSGWSPIDCFVAIPKNYRNAELALNRYASQSSYNPLVHSFLNVLIHDKQAKAFVSNSAIQMALNELEQFDRQAESVLRQMIYGKNCSTDGVNCQLFKPIVKPSPELNSKITAELDSYFADTPTDDLF